MLGCICLRRRAPSPEPDEDKTTVAVHRQLSTMTTWTCLETPSARSEDGDSAALLHVARRRMRLLEEYVCDPHKRFTQGSLTSGGVQLAHLVTAGEPLVAKGHIFLPGIFDIGRVVEAITEELPRREWDKEMVHHVPIRELFADERESLNQVYSSYKGRFGILGRDFVWNVYNAWESPSVAFHVTFSNSETISGFEPSDKFVRATTWLAGYRIERLAGGLSIDFVNQTDIGGRGVPQWIVQSVMKRTPDQLALLSQYIHAKGL